MINYKRLHINILSDSDKFPYLVSFSRTIIFIAVDRIATVCDFWSYSLNRLPNVILSTVMNFTILEVIANICSATGNNVKYNIDSLSERETKKNQKIFFNLLQTIQSLMDTGYRLG